MEIIKNDYNEIFYISNIFHEYMNHLNCVFLDIETTGLNSEINKVILAGILTVHDDSLSSIQFFANNKNEEAILLEHLANLLQKKHIIYNYNASSFDIPFLNKRFQKNNINFQIPSYCSFDLYRIIKNYEHVKLPDFKLKTVEKYLGIERSDTISGKESIVLYNQYLKNKNLKLKETILNHNMDDIYYLSKILSLLKKYDLHKIMFENPRYVRNNDIQKIVITKSQIKKSGLLAKGCSTKKKNEYTAFSYGYNFKYDNNDDSFQLEIPLYQQDNLKYILLSDFDFSYKKVVPLPHIPNDIIIIADNNTINYKEINSFLDALLIHLIYKS